jgi:hypothetical protein
MTTVLSATFTDMLDTVEVDITRLRGAVGDRTVAADDRKQLRTMLANTLYDAWHVGRPPVEGPAARMTRDHEFEKVLRAAVPHRTSLVEVQSSPEIAEAGSTVIQMGGIRVRVATEQLVSDGDAEATRLRVPAVLPVISPGFLMVNGSRGGGLSGSECLRIYFHLTGPETAPDVWGAVLKQLEDLSVSYQAKVTSSRVLFPRRDGIVVYLGPQSWSAVTDVKNAAVATGGLGSGVSAYVARLDAGVGYAWDPNDPRPGMRGMSFGEHRSHAVAAGLITAAAANGSGDRHAAVAEALLAAGIDPGRPFRNATSPAMPADVAS